MSVDNHTHEQIYKSSKTISFEYIIDHLEMRWDWNAVSMNPSVTIEDVKDNPYLRWNYEILISRFGSDE